MLPIRSFAACVSLAAAPMFALAEGAAPPAVRDTTRKVFVVPGLRNGTSIFPLANYKEVQPVTPGVMDFRHYHSSAEIEDWMRRWAKEHPEIVEL